MVCLSGRYLASPNIACIFFLIVAQDIFIVEPLLFFNNTAARDMRTPPEPYPLIKIQTIVFIISRKTISSS